MYLAELSISGFRRIEDLTLRFAPGLNVLVGPNNVGKTAVVDALRALLTTSDEGALRVDEYDLHSQGTSTVAEITFRYVFRQLSTVEEADFLHALVPMPSLAGAPVEYEARFALRYAATGLRGRLRPKRWCGLHEENAVTTEMLEDLRAVYLQPLRDPASGLRPGRSSQLARLVDRLADDKQKADIVELLREFEDELAKKPPVAGTQVAVEKRHGDMLGPELRQRLQIGLTPAEFQRIAARLELNVESFDIEQNGLGYNNLIYMAVVLSEMALNAQAAYKALIIEEPEAHLHPQLQAVLLGHLQSIEEAAPGETPVQIFVTSHSPHFASGARLDSLVCIQQSGSKVIGFSPRDAAFESKKKQKLERYLDVTRAELFFARRIVLVEGAAERFLVSALAARLGINLRHRSVSVLSTEGLNFDCFMPLFGDAAIPIRVAILTDADPAGLFPSLADPLDLSSAAAAIQSLKGSHVQPFFAKKTLEYDLALHPENHGLMLAALAELHPRIVEALRKDMDDVDPADKAKTLYSAMFGRPSGGVRKGEYAQALAALIASGKGDFKVPQYIEDALNYVIAS